MPVEPRFFSVFRSVARGLEAQRIALGVASDNIANATTTRTPDGTPYRLRRTLQELPEGRYDRFAMVLRNHQIELAQTDPRHRAGHGVERTVRGADLGPETQIVELDAERLEYDPNHPDADANGYVHYPDVNVVEEMAYMISANRIYEANLSTLQAAKEMLKRTLEI